MSTLEITTVNPSEYGIAENQATELVGNLPQIKAERAILEEQYAEIIKMDIEDPETAKKAKKLRLLFKDNRTKGINVWHSTTKEFFLKGGQFVDAIKRKEIAVNERIELNLENIEKYADNLEKERKAKLNAERISELEPYNAFVPMGLNFGDLSDDEYSKVLNGAKLQFEHQQAEEEKVEAERQRLAEIQKLHNSRKESLLPVWQFIENKDLNFGEMTDTEFSSIKENADSKKIEFDAEQEKIKAENERLKQLEIDRLLKLEQNAEKHIKTLVDAGFEISNNDSYMDNLQHRYGKGNYSVSVGNLQNMTTEEVSEAITNVNNWIKENDRIEKEKADAEKKLAKERADQAAKLKAEQDAKAKIEAELQAKKDAEAKAETERLAEEKRLKEEAEALAKAPIKDQLNVWVTSFELPSANIENEKADLIKAKFEAFKRWAFAEIELM